MENDGASIVYIITIKSFNYCDNNYSNLAKLCCYVCLITLISISRYVYKRNNNNNKKDSKTNVIFLSAVYLPIWSGLKGNLQSLYRPEIVT